MNRRRHSSERQQGESTALRTVCVEGGVEDMGSLPNKQDGSASCSSTTKSPLPSNVQPPCLHRLRRWLYTCVCARVHGAIPGIPLDGDMRCQLTSVLVVGSTFLVLFKSTYRLMLWWVRPSTTLLAIASCESLAPQNRVFCPKILQQSAPADPIRMRHVRRCESFGTTPLEW